MSKLITPSVFLNGKRARAKIETFAPLKRGVGVPQ
jgi:hypothetical protein